MQQTTLQKKEIPAAWPLKFLVVRSDRFAIGKESSELLPSALVRAAGNAPESRNYKSKTPSPSYVSPMTRSV